MIIKFSLLHVKEYLRLGRWMCRAGPLGGNMRLCRRSTLQCLLNIVSRKKETDIFFRENSRKKLHRGAISGLGWDGLEVAQDLHLSGVMILPLIKVLDKLVDTKKTAQGWLIPVSVSWISAFYP